MSIWEAAGAAISAVFADPEPIIYYQGASATGPFPAIRSIQAAPDFPGSGATARETSYEIGFDKLAVRPKNGDTITHRGRTWRVGDVTDLEDVRAWKLIVSDAGLA